MTTFTQYGCGCPTADVCCDPKTWGRVAEPVDIIGTEPTDPGEPLAYRVRFADGIEATAFEDELDPTPVEAP